MMGYFKFFEARASVFRRLALAAGCLLASFILSYALTALPRGGMLFLFFSAAALVVAWYGGVSLGLAVLAGSWFPAHYLFVHSAGVAVPNWRVSEPTLVLLASFLTLVAGILLVDSLHRNRRRARASAKQEHFYRGQLEEESHARHLADQSRRNTEDTLARLLEDAPLGILWLSNDGRVQWASGEALRMLGYEREEVFGQPASKFAAESPEALARIFAPLPRGENLQNLALRLRCKSGAICEVSVNLDTVWEDGRFCHARVFLRDVTERNRAERHLSIQYAISQILVYAHSFEAAATQILRVLCQSARWEAGIIWMKDAERQRLSCVAMWHDPTLRLDALQTQCRGITFARGEGLPGKVWEKGEPIFLPDFSEHPFFLRTEAARAGGLGGAYGFPIKWANKCEGVLELLSREMRAPDEEFLQSLRALNRQMGQFLERTEVEATLHQAQAELEKRVAIRTAELTSANSELERQITVRHRLEKELIEITEEERIRIGQNLHDDLGQRLTGIAFLTKSLGDRLLKKKAREASEAARIEGMVNEAIAHTRELSRNLTSVRLGGDDLPAALEILASQTQRLFKISCRFKTVGVIPKLGEAVARQFYNIAQESVTNAIRHAQARHISIRLSSSAEQVVLAVRNNGKPFAPVTGPSPNQGMGLRIMNYRANIVGAQLHIDSKRKHGAIVVCSMPIKQRLLPGLGVEWHATM